MSAHNLLVARVGHAYQGMKLIPLSSMPSPQGYYPNEIAPLPDGMMGSGTMSWQQALKSGAVMLLELPNIDSVKQLAKGEIAEQFLKLLKDLATEQTIRTIEEQVTSRTSETIIHLQERVAQLEDQVRELLSTTAGNT